MISNHYPARYWSLVRYAVVCVAMPLISAASAWGGCAITAAPKQTSGTGYWSGTRFGHVRLNVVPLRAEFSFKCDSDAYYQLVLNETAGLPRGFTRLISADGLQVAVQVILRSVGGKTENLPFSDLPSLGYQGRAIGGRLYVVALDLMPYSIFQAGVNIQSSQFNGNLLIDLLH